MGLKIVHEGQIALLEFDHGKANEIGSAQLDALEALEGQLVSTQTRALISFSRRISRRGTPIFIAGANVTERGGWSQEKVAKHVRRQRRVLAEFRKMPLWHVAVVNGVALGWGTEYLITADYRIATEQAIFGLPETSLGILPGAGGSSELASLIGLPQAMRLGMTGEKIGAKEALRIGLIQEIVSSVDEGLARARELSAAVCRRSPTAVVAFKRAVLACIGKPPEEREEIEALAYEHCLHAGEAEIGRKNFKAILSGESVSWGPMSPFDPNSGA